MTCRIVTVACWFALSVSYSGQPDGSRQLWSKKAKAAQTMMVSVELHVIRLGGKRQTWEGSAAKGQIVLNRDWASQDLEKTLFLGEGYADRSSFPARLSCDYLRSRLC